MFRARSQALGQTGTAWTHVTKLLDTSSLPTEHSQHPWPTLIHKLWPGDAPKTPVDQSQYRSKGTSKNWTEQATEFQRLRCVRHMEIASLQSPSTESGPRQNCDVTHVLQLTA